MDMLGSAQCRVFLATYIKVKNPQKKIATVNWTGGVTIRMNKSPGNWKTMYPT